MKKLIIAALLLALLPIAFACGATSDDVADRDQIKAAASGLTIHKIGVPTYDINDSQVKMFKDYLDNYVKSCFEDVTFIYSESITNADELMDFLDLCAQEGAEGIMAFISYDLAAEVDLCAANGMYYIRPAGTTEDAEFNSVADNPYYVGEIGPGAAVEYDSGVKMTEALADPEGNHKYIVLSGGAPTGNEMHRLRTLAVLETLQNIYGVTFAETAETLAVSPETTVAQAGSLQVAVCPGYELAAAADTELSALISSGEYDVMLSAIPVTPLLDDLSEAGIRCGVIDCFSEANYYAFKQGTLAYLAGKYRSEIGPGFAALYNAMTGGAEIYRPDGRAFRLTQGFWTASSFAEYEEQYALAASLAVNAYDYGDLYAAVQTLDPAANFADFAALVQAYDYDSCRARRGE